MTDRVDMTDAAASMLRSLREQHGELMFHQSGGCCDGSSPMCFADGDFLTGDADEHLGDLPLGDGVTVPFWMSKAQYEYWKHTHLTSTWCRAAGRASRWRRPRACASSSAPAS